MTNDRVRSRRGVGMKRLITIYVGFVQKVLR